MSEEFNRVDFIEKRYKSLYNVAKELADIIQKEIGYVPLHYVAALINHNAIIVTLDELNKKASSQEILDELNKDDKNE